MRVDVSMSDIAKHELSKIEKIGDTFAVSAPRGVYFARFAPKIMGALEPADRQLLARWIRYGGAHEKSELSTYLTEALAAETKPQVVIAVDLTDIADEEYLAKVLAISPAVKQAQGDPAQLAALFASLRGLRLTVTVGEDITGAFRLDFGQPIKAHEALMKGIVLEWFDHAGARVSVLADAKAVVKDSSFMMQTPIDEQALRRILSLIQTQQPAEASENQPNAGQANAIASQRYYKGVLANVRDLETMNKKSADYQKTALWHENYAKRIDSLSTTGVDPDLVAWGYSVAQNLRGLAGSLRGVPLEVEQLQRAIRTHTQAYFERSATTEWGNLYRPEVLTISSNLQDVRAAQQEVFIKGHSDRDQVWSIMEQDRQSTVGKMREKYGVDFDAKK
jgi:hypothetical protein